MLSCGGGGDRTWLNDWQRVERVLQNRLHALIAAGSPHFHQLVHQVVGNAVVVRVEGDVVIDVHTGAAPLAEIKRLGGKRVQ